MAILGIDNFSRKNRRQVTGLGERGYVFDVFTNDTLGDSAANLPSPHGLFVLERGALARTRQVAEYLRRQRRSLHHVEVYPAGRFAPVYVALAKLWRVPVMTVERGDLLYRTQSDAAMRFAMDVCYRHADVVWCREPYQDRMLEAIGASCRFFLPNVVEVPPEPPGSDGRSIDFVWVNRLIPERRADWVADVLAEPPFARARALMLGFMERTADPVGHCQDAIARRRPPNLEIRAYSDPTAAYRAGRFFLLPSEVVFCNNALLEAMASGVVPLVSDVEGARRIVDDGVDGFVFPHSLTGLRTAMERALTLSPEARSRMSAAAIQKVRQRFSVTQWCDALEAQYRALGPRR